MRSAWWKLAFLLGLCGSTVWGQEIEQVNWGRRKNPPCCPAPMPCVPETAPPAPGTPPTPGQSPSEQALSEAFAQAGESGTMPSGSFMPAFFGDMFGVTGTRFIQGATGGGVAVKVPSASRAAGWKIVDGESPRPTNRVYFNFDYYNDIDRSLNLGTGGQVFQGFRYLIGLEKTLLRGDASVGLRLPFVSVTGVPGQQDQQFGDMSIVTKYALVNDPCSGRVLSGGLVITVPTGQGFLIDMPNPQTGQVDGPRPFVLFDVVLQPWAGFIRNITPDLYSHGFVSVAVPTNSLDVTILTNDLGVGWWLYRNARDRFVQGIIPTFEVHSNTPLNHGGIRTVPISFAYQLNLTSGVYVVLPRSTLGFAAGVPVVGPKPYDYELTATYSFRF